MAVRDPEGEEEALAAERLAGRREGFAEGMRAAEKVVSDLLPATAAARTQLRRALGERLMAGLHGDDCDP
jgi:hypothetical protein